MNKNSSIVIIGGGIVGCAIAYELSHNGYTNIRVIEKNTTIPGLNQSSTNEGSIHSGVFYPKAIMPLKAMLCVQGNALLYAFMQKYNVPHKKVGKLIVATNFQQEAYLDFFFQVAVENGVPGIKKITREQAKDMEPNIFNVTAALHVPSCGCAPPSALIKKIKELAEKQRVTFTLGVKVIAILENKNIFTIQTKTPKGTSILKADMIINSAGLYSDEVAKMINSDFPYVIDPTRGEFFQYDKSIRKNGGINGLHVYQTPYCYNTKNGEMNIINTLISRLPKLLKQGSVFITVGTHLSPAYDEIDGKYILGNRVTISPLKTPGVGKEDYTTNLHPPADYIEKIHSIFPHLKEGDIKFDHTGIMCPLKGYRDFVIEKDEKFSNFINLVGMESPAWTSCFAIAKYVGNIID